MANSKRRAASLTAAALALLVLAVVLFRLRRPSRGSIVEARPGKGALFVIKQSYVGSNGGAGSVVEVIDVAEKLGYLRDEGLELKDVGSLGVSNAEKLVALNRGIVDLVHLPVPTAVAAIATGVKAKFIAPLMTTTVREPEGAEVSTGGLVVRAGRGLKSPADFIGKKIGLAGRGSSPDYFLQRWFKGAQVDLGKVDIVLVPSTNSLQALKAGTVDGVWLFSSGYFDAKKDPALESVAQDSSIVGARLHCGYLVTNELIRQHPREVAALARAIVKAWNWEAEHPKELREISREILKDHKLDPELARYVYAWQLPEGRIRDDDATFWIDELTASGQVKVPLKASDLFANLAYSPPEG